MTTVRDWVREIQSEIRATNDLQPSRVPHRCIECVGHVVALRAFRCKSCASRLINRGRVHTAATREKFRQAKLGKPQSVEVRRKRSEALRGSRCYRWQGGKTSEAERIRKSLDYKVWRSAVFARDDYTCQGCGQRGGRLNADHIFPFASFPSMRLMLHNGQTLCVNCHKQTPSYLTKMQTEPTTVRGMIQAIQREVGNKNIDLVPDRAAELLVRLSSLVGNCLDEIREADAAYSVVLLRCLDSDEAANRARIRAEITPEHRRKREARDTRELAKEMIGTLKFFLRAKADEMRFT